MKLFIIIFLTIILIIFIAKFIINRSKRLSYLKAGKKWEGIVKELSDRK